MTWKTVALTRQKLFDEVWIDPVTKVAKRYGLSDVGLKKICKKLAIPTPPLGYWARLRNGQNPIRPALKEFVGPVEYHHSKYIRDVDDVLAARLLAAKTESTAPPIQPTLEIFTEPGSLHPLIRKCRKELNGKARDSRDWPVTAVNGPVVLAISAGAIERALVLGDLAVPYCLQAKFRFEQAAQSVGFVAVDGEQFRLRFSEKGLRKQRERTPAEKEDARKYPTSYGNRIYYESIPTGSLRLDISRAGSSYSILSFSDGKTQKIEDSIQTLPLKLKEIALEARIQKQINQERGAERERARLERERLCAIRDEALKKLKNVEKEASDWERALRLKAFADALQAVDARESSELVSWIRRTADWLNPLVRGDWPEVDDAPTWV